MKQELIGIKEAADMLKMTPEGLRVKLRNGDLPARKVGRRWIFVLSDLVDYVRYGYPKTAETLQGVDMTERRIICHSTKEATSGGLSSLTVENEYSKLLERRIGN